jgi:hypothetical protein
MKRSESIKQLATDLAKAQKKIKHAGKDANNPHYRNDYASLESVIDATKEALLEHNITVLQGMSEDGGSLYTMLLHTSGEFIETDLKLVLSKQDMQGLGSAITYARRYALAAVTNISQVDDDANDASGKPAPRAVSGGGKKGKAAAPTATTSDDEF